MHPTSFIKKHAVCILVSVFLFLLGIGIDNMFIPQWFGGKVQINTFPASEFIKLGDVRIRSGQLLENLGPGDYSLKIYDGRENPIVDTSVIIRPGKKKELEFCLIPQPDPNLDPNLPDDDIVVVYIPEQSRMVLKAKGYKLRDFIDHPGDITYWAKASLSRSFVDFAGMEKFPSWEGSIEVSPGDKTKQLPISLLFHAVKLNFIFNGNNYPVVSFYVPRHFTKCIGAVDKNSFKFLGTKERFRATTFSMEIGTVKLPFSRGKEFSPELIPKIDVSVISGGPLDISGPLTPPARSYYAPQVIESETKGTYRLEIVVHPDFSVQISPIPLPLQPVLPTRMLLLRLFHAIVRIDYLDIVIRPAKLGPSLITLPGREKQQ